MVESEATANGSPADVEPGKSDDEKEGEEDLDSLLDQMK
jgi:hypothetical protein